MDNVNHLIYNSIRVFVNYYYITTSPTNAIVFDRLLNRVHFQVKRDYYYG